MFSNIQYIYANIHSLEFSIVLEGSLTFSQTSWVAQNTVAIFLDPPGWSRTRRSREATWQLEEATSNKIIERLDNGTVPDVVVGIFRNDSIRSPGVPGRSSVWCR